MKEHGKDSWWYYFDRIGKTTKAQCKVPTCKKVIDQGPTKATNKLECHLKNYHKPLYEQREKAKKEVEQRKQAQQNKLSFNRKISEIIQGLLIVLSIKLNVKYKEEAGTSSAKEVEECVTNENAEPEEQLLLKNN
jgi:large-conductance mechanosensitive channel